MRKELSREWRRDVATTQYAFLGGFNKLGEAISGVIALFIAVVLFAYCVLSIFPLLLGPLFRAANRSFLRADARAGSSAQALLDS